MGIVDEIVAIRERWHTKRHPFFQAFAEGKLPLRAMGTYMAMHWQFVQRALASFGLVYERHYAHEDVRKMLVENLAEEEGLRAIPREGHEPHDHSELIFRFCRAAGLSEAEVRATPMTPAWWARSPGASSHRGGMVMAVMAVSSRDRGAAVERARSRSSSS